MILRILKHGEPALKKKCLPVVYSEIKDELPGLLKDMWETLRAANGVGLAAPQVGLALRLSVIETKPEGKPDPLVLLNPEIVSAEGSVCEEEGCLSVPGLYAKVKRHEKVRLRALDEHGRRWERTGTGLLARAFQHEIDHLDGKLFLDHLTLIQKLRVAPILKDLRKTWT